MAVSLFVFVSSIPALIPSIIFSILFLSTTCLHLYRIIETRRYVYIFLFVFSLFRTILFIIRIVWSQNVDSNQLPIVSGIFTSGAFFIIVLAIYTLLKDWILTLGSASQISANESRCLTKLTIYERYTLNTVECLLPAFSILFVIGSIKEFDTDTGTDLAGDVIIKISKLCFLTSVTLYIIFVTYFALKYSNRPIHLQLKVLVLYIVGALLLIELIYGTVMTFAPSTNKFDKYSWVFYVFEPLPEVLILIILGGVILNEWFFEIDDVESLPSAKTLSISSVGNRSTSIE